MTGSAAASAGEDGPSPASCLGGNGLNELRVGTTLAPRAGAVFPFPVEATMNTSIAAGSLLAALTLFSTPTSQLLSPIFQLPSTRGAPSPICSMKDKNHQPKNERECSGWERDEH